MKSNIQLLLLFILLMLLSSAPSSHALTPRGRQRTGSIQQVDAPTRHGVLLADDDGKPITFTWSNRTMFVADNRVADAAMMTKGKQVQITLHRPFFGEPFVTRVILLSLPHPPKQPTADSSAARFRRVANHDFQRTLCPHRDQRDSDCLIREYFANGSRFDGLTGNVSGARTEHPHHPPQENALTIRHVMRTSVQLHQIHSPLKIAKSRQPHSHHEKAHR